MKKSYGRILDEAARDTSLVAKNEYLNCYKTNDDKGTLYGGTLFSPFALWSLCSGQYFIKVSPLIYNEIITFFEEIEYELFSDVNFNSFLNYISEILLKYNWKIDSRSYIYKNIYAIEKIESLDVSKILDTTIKITTPSDLINVSGSVYNIAVSSNEFFGTVLDNEVVSICGYSYMGFESVDIGIHTNENHRQKGYANSNVISMAKYILGKGKGVEYQCANTNVISQKTAISAGFSHTANRYILFCTD